jgi:diguanylate cyclase (GGDEF)-like protein
MGDIVNVLCVLSSVEQVNLFAWSSTHLNTVIWGGLAVAAVLVVLLRWTSDRHVSSGPAQRDSAPLPEPPRVETHESQHPTAVATADPLASDLLSFENFVLKEFLSEARIDQALDRLLERLCPDINRHWAVFLEIAGSQVRVRTSRGLSSATMGKLSTDRGLWRELVGLVTGSHRGSELHETYLYRSLANDEQAGCEELFFVRGHSPGQQECLLISSMLFDAHVPRDRCLAIAQQLVDAAARQIADRQTIESSTAELKLLRAMLELRSMTGGEQRSSKAALESMLSGLARLCGFQHAVIYSTRKSETGGRLRAAFRTSRLPDEPLSETWSRQEDAIARLGIESPAVKAFDAAELLAVVPDGVLTGAAVVPLYRRGKLRGLLVLSRNTAGLPCPVDRSMLEWCAETLQEVLFQTLDRMAIERQALLDALTGIANRHAFNQELDRTFERLRGGAVARCSLILLDVDRFKSINDRFGHLAGDDALKAVAATIDGCVSQTRISDQPLVARFGGEEFAVLLPGVGLDGAERIAESIRVAVREVVVRSGSCEFQATISAGVATADQTSSARSLVGNADAALYEAKSAGRDRVCSAGSTVDA